ncbi:hypothetical protein [Clostridium beijerinckii]|uniref:hypothetical protein n=1 Tax=Clostridium beijerinckii TaxID=1520 RepID=UPI00186592C0|nr:hypothetical protein [Clostridium beijerinckii]
MKVILKSEIFKIKEKYQYTRQFELDNSIESLHSLEFITWFVRDNAREGVKIQLRPYALVPVTPHGRQFGKTLRFHIDLFIDGVEQTLQPVFEVIKELN